MKAISQREYKAFEDVDDDSEVTPSSKVKGKVKTGHQGKRVLPSTSNSAIFSTCNAMDVAQSLMHILEFKLDGDLGERQVVYLQKGDDNIEDSGQNEEGVAGPSDLEPEA
ncbi:hypothetical protein ACFX13_047188 [Malus domestica]